CHIKSTSLLANVMANTAAVVDGFDEGILVRDGTITEGSHTNIFFVKDGSLLTHPADRHILNGITRRIVLELCREMGIPVIEKGVALEDIAGMEEALLTATTTQIASRPHLHAHSPAPPRESGPTPQRTQ